MPGWIWGLILSSLAAEYPTVFLVVACIAACIVWPAFRAVAAVLFVIAIVQVVAECRKENERLKATTPLDIDTVKTAPMLVKKALQALVLTRTQRYAKLTPALIESLAEKAACWSPRAQRREHCPPDAFKGIAPEFNAKISLAGARQAVLETFGLHAELKSLSRHAAVYEEQSGGRTTVWLLGRTPDLAEPAGVKQPKLRVSYGGVIEKTPSHVALKGVVSHPWFKELKPALLTLAAAPDKGSPFGWAFQSIRLEADFWPPKFFSAPEAGLTQKKAILLLERALQTAVETGQPNYRAISGQVLDMAAMHSAAWSPYALRRAEHAAFVFDGVPERFDAKISLEDARRAVRECLGRRPPLSRPEKLGPVQVEGEGARQKVWILGKSAAPRTVHCQIELLRLEPKGRTVFLDGRLASPALSTEDCGRIQVDVLPDGDSPFGYVFESLWIKMPEDFVETSALPQPAPSHAGRQEAAGRAGGSRSGGAGPGSGPAAQNQRGQAGPAAVTLSKDEIAGRLLAIFKAKTAQPRPDASGQSAGRDVQADAEAFLARIPRRFIDRAARGKATQEECDRLVDAILAEMGLAPAKAAPEEEAKTGRENLPLQKRQATTSSKPKPCKAAKAPKAAKAGKAAKTGRMPLRRPRSEDDVCDILFDVFEARTAKPLRDASGKIVGKDGGGSVAAFIARVPQEFIDHALRWETTQEEYERFVDGIIAEMDPKDTGGADPEEVRARLEREEGERLCEAQAAVSPRKGRMPNRRPRSEDDVYDILFEIFEARTAKPLRDASGKIVGKDGGGNGAAFIDRVPLEFIDHALRWETTLEEYEAFVDRIIAGMDPRDTGGAKPASLPSPQEEAELQTKIKDSPVQPVQPVQQVKPNPAAPRPGATPGGLSRKLVQRLLAHALDAAMATGFTHFDSLTDEMLDQTALDSASWSSLAERRSALFPARFAGVPDGCDARISVEDARRAACDCFGKAAPLASLPEDSRVFVPQAGGAACSLACGAWILGQWRGWGSHGLRVRPRTVEALGKMSAMAGEVLDGKGQKQGEIRVLVHPDAGSPFGFVIESLHFA